MAYQAKGRDPIFDSTTQALIERRGKELIGLALLALAVGFAMLIWLLFARTTRACSPPPKARPATCSARSAPPSPRRSPSSSARAPGASSSGSPSGACGSSPISAKSGRWAGRVFVPIAVALGAVYASTLVPGPDWSHHLRARRAVRRHRPRARLLAILPGSPALGLKLLTLVVLRRHAVRRRFRPGREPARARQCRALHARWAPC